VDQSAAITREVIVSAKGNAVTINGEEYIGKVEREVYWRIDALITPRNLGETLYHLVFPNREFWKLPDSVQESYCLDALKLLRHFGAKQAHE
jgi:hypothetical protein